MSMNPGVTAQPDASSSRSPRRLGAISVMTPSEMATSALRPAAPLPSKTVPPRMTRSAVIGHELHEVAVGITDVHARAIGPATAVPSHRSLFDRCPYVVEERAERLLRALPHEAKVAARWRGRRRPQGEPFPPPGLGAVEVDHLTACVNRDHGRKLGHVEAQ